MIIAFHSVSKQYVPGDLLMRVQPAEGQAGFSTILGINKFNATPSQFLSSITMYRDKLRTTHLESLERDIIETERNAIINIKIPYGFSDFISGKLKFGGKYRYSNRENDETQYFIQPDRHITSQVFTRMMMDSLWSDLGLSEDDIPYGIRANLFEDAAYDVGNFLSGKENVDEFFYTGSLDKMKHYKALAKRYNSFFNNSQYSFQNDYNYKGNTAAFYIMTEMSLGEYIEFIPGIRYESFETDYSAFQTTFFGPMFYDFTNKKVGSNRKNDHWFPQMHLRIKPVDWCDVRLASTRTIIYPDYRAFSPFYYFVPNGILNVQNNPSISLGNTNLNPAFVQAYDIYTSFYENYIGLLTCGYFYKEIDDLITNFNFTTKDAGKINNIVALNPNANTSVETWINLESKTFVRGFEVDWQTNFWYLPSYLRGLVFNINYSYMRSSTKYPYQVLVKEGTGPWAKSRFIDTSRTGRMPHQSNDILNMTIGYDIYGFSARISFVYQGNVLGQIAHREELDSFTDDFYRWDFIINQKLPWDGFQLYCNMNNITNRPDRNSTSILGLLSYAGYYGRTAELGIRYKL